MINSSYPAPPMSAIPTVLLEAFQAERAYEERDEPAETVDTVSVQRVFALLAGAKTRALTCGGLKGHDVQAAAILVAIDEFDSLLGGSVTVGGEAAFRKKFDREEWEALMAVRSVLERLLEWHFQNGAGALLPYAEYLQLVWRPERRVAA